MAKNSSSGNVGKGIAIGILAAVIGIGGTCALGYSSRNSAGKWFGGLHWKDTQSKTEQNSATMGNVIVSDSDGNGVELCSAVISEADFAAYGVSAQAETAYTLTIETVPENTLITNFVWSAEFENSGSAWAAGKKASDYVTVTPAADNRSAVVSCLQGYGEPILIKAAYGKDPAIFATKKADYMKRITGYTLTDPINTFNDGGMEGNINVTFGVGTKTPQRNVDGDYISIELTNEAYTYLTTEGTPANEYYRQYLTLNQDNPLKQQGTKVFADPDHYDMIWHTFDIGDFLGKPPAQGYSYLESAFYLLGQNVTTPQLIYTIGIDYDSLEKEHDRITFTETKSIECDYLTLFTSMNLTGGNYGNGLCF